MPSEQDLKKEIERLRAENEALKKPARGQMSLRVSEKGALSVYGLGRFPVTLYREQWEKLLGMADEIRIFIHETGQTHDLGLAGNSALHEKNVIFSPTIKASALRRPGCAPRSSSPLFRSVAPILQSVWILNP